MPNPINQERLARAITALRSGEHSQTTGALKCGSRFCALGVLCEVSGLGEWVIQGSDDSPALYKVNKGTAGFYSASSASLPTAVADWYGFDSDNPVIVLPSEDDTEEDTYPEFLSVTAANDYRELPFSVIADALERTFMDA